MKTILLLTLLAASTLVNAQKVKSVQIFDSNIGTLTCQYVYGTDTTVNIVLLGRNYRYTHIIDYIVIYSGTPSDVVEFFNDVEILVNENEPSTTCSIDGQMINISGVGKFSIYESHGSLGYHIYTLKQWQKLKLELNNFVNLNGL